jgi:surface protein
MSSSNDDPSSTHGAIPEETHPRNDDTQLPDDRLPIANAVNGDAIEERFQEKRRLEERVAQQVRQLRELDAAASRGWTSAVILLVMVVVAAIVAGVILTSDSNEENLPQPTLAPSSNDDVLTSKPPLSPPPKCFETTEELRQAVDKFMLDSEEAKAQLAASYGQPIGTLCFSQGITDFSSLFDSQRNLDMVRFNGNISMWDMASANNTNYMFWGADAFNQDVSSWDVSKISTMNGMFYGATSFDLKLSSWNTASAEDMSNMFRRAKSLNKDLSAWDVSKVSTMRSMFNEAASFDQDLSLWNTSSVEDMSYMVRASSFNKDLSTWDVSKVVGRPMVRRPVQMMLAVVDTHHF